MPYIKSNFSIKENDIDRIREAISKLGFSSEEVINNYLHNVAGDKMVKGMNIPKSPRKGVIHARGSKWWEQDNYNLAVSISNSLKGKRGSSFYYLYYVVTGTGTNKEKGPRNFMEEGLNKEYKNIVDGLVNEITKNIDKEMK